MAKKTMFRVHHHKGKLSVEEYRHIRKMQEEKQNVPKRLPYMENGTMVQNFLIWLYNGIS